jgi:hypothetical protein
VESSLHRELKRRYGPDAGGRSEVALAGCRVDAVGADGELVEVQSGALGPLRAKLGRLLASKRVRVVKPVVTARRIVKRARADGRDLSARFSPKRGAVLDVFDDLVGLVGVFPDPNLWVEVLAVEIDEIRLQRRRARRGFVVADRVLRAVSGSVTLHVAADLWRLAPGFRPVAPFTTLELAESLGRPLDFAQRAAYCLRLAGAVDVVGKAGNRRVYVAAQASAAVGAEAGASLGIASTTR